MKSSVELIFDTFKAQLGSAGLSWAQLCIGSAAKESAFSHFFKNGESVRWHLACAYLARKKLVEYF